MDDTPATPPLPAPAPQATIKPMAERFRGYLPVVVDAETGGFDWNRHALLELAAIPVEIETSPDVVFDDPAIPEPATPVAADGYVPPKP